MLRSRLTVTIAVSALLAAACGGSPSTGQQTATRSGDDPSAPRTSAGLVASGSEAESVQVEHAMGTTEVPCTPQRVITLGQGQTDSTLALGVEPVGIVEPWTDEFYDYLPDVVHNIKIVGSELEPDLEAIAALEPDVILGSKLRHEQIYGQLAEIAPTVFSETIGRTWKGNVSLWAKALCRPEEGERVLSEWDERATAFREELGELSDTTVSLIRFMPDEVRIYLTGFPGSVLREAGLERPEAQQVDDWEASEQLTAISQERIPEMDGEVIFVMTSDWRPEGGTVELKEEWTSHPLWQKLTAVQNGAVFGVNEEHWNLGGGILAANATLDDLEQHFLEPGGVRATLTSGDGA